MDTIHRSGGEFGGESSSHGEMSRRSRTNLKKANYPKGDSTLHPYYP